MADPVRVAYTVMQSWHRVPGGSTSSVLSLARALNDRDDVELTGIGPWFGGVPPTPFRPPMRVVRIPAPYQLIYDIWHHTSLFAPPKVVSSTDVIHATTVTVPRPGKSGLVVTIHDLFPLTHPELYTTRGLRIMGDGIARARDLANVVCVPSQTTFNACVDAGFDSGRLRVVPWGASRTDVNEQALRRVRDRYSLDRPYVLWVGTAEQRRNLPTLLEAYGKLQPLNEELVLVGPPGNERQLRGHLHGAGSKVRQLGFVPDVDLAALYAGAKVFCLPSLREGFGMRALDAMVQGTPVLASAGTAAADLIGDVGVTVEPRDSDAWAEALRALLEDPLELKRLGIAARARSDRYTWERCASEMAGIYREAAS